MEDRLGKYEIRRPLGKGAAGIVYEAWDPAIARHVAIKTVPLPGARSSRWPPHCLCSPGHALHPSRRWPISGICRPRWRSCTGAVDGSMRRR